VASLLVAAVATVIIGVLTGIPAQLFDVSAAKDKLRSGPPLSVSADIIFLDDEGRSMAMPGDYRPNGRVEQMMAKPKAGVSSEFLGAIRDAGGVQVTTLTIRAILEDRRNQEIRILDIRPVISERAEPFGGTLFFIPPQEGAATMRMMIDLDRPDPIVSEAAKNPTTGKIESGKPFFADTTISLHDREQEVLIIRATAVLHYVAFKLQIHYRLGDKDMTTLISDHGQPFRITGFHFGPQHSVLAYEGAYELQGDYSLRQTTDPSRMDCLGLPGCSP